MPTTQLLISVRNADEARAALIGGADLIDIKEPSAGPLGMAKRHTIDAILREIAGRRPVSAALGELADTTAIAPLPDALRYVKLGLAHAPADWRARLHACAKLLGPHRFIAVAYADHARTAAPPVDEVLDWAVSHGVAGLLLDTAIKDGRGLLDWCTASALRGWTEMAHRHGMLVALAGSLSEKALPQVLPCGADVIAVRGAACAQQNREATVQSTCVRQLKRTVATYSATAVTHAG